MKSLDVRTSVVSFFFQCIPHCCIGCVWTCLCALFSQLQPNLLKVDHIYLVKPRCLQHTTLNKIIAIGVPILSAALFLLVCLTVYLVISSLCNALMSHRWEGKNENEVGRCQETGVIHVKVDAKYYRPTEVVSY